MIKVSKIVLAAKPPRGWLTPDDDFISVYERYFGPDHEHGSVITAIFPETEDIPIYQDIIEFGKKKGWIRLRAYKGDVVEIELNSFNSGQLRRLQNLFQSDKAWKAKDVLLVIRQADFWIPFKQFMNARSVKDL